MISHKHKFIFVHIPKCGGTSVCKLLDIGASIHGRIDRYITDKTRNYFKFTFIRNPWDRFVSLYNYYIKGSEIYGKRGAMPFVSFEHFVDRMNNNCEMLSLQVSENRHVRKVHYESQLSFIESSKLGTTGIDSLDYLGRFENLQEDVNIVCDKIGIPRKSLPHINKTKHKHYTEYYDEETKQIVAKKYAKDIEYFNYEFGE